MKPARPSFCAPSIGFVKKFPKLNNPSAKFRPAEENPSLTPEEPRYAKRSYRKKKDTVLYMRLSLLPNEHYAGILKNTYPLSLVDVFGIEGKVG